MYISNSQHVLFIALIAHNIFLFLYNRKQTLTFFVRWQIKCLPILLYGLEACPLDKTNVRSLVFSVNRFFMI